MSAGFDIRVEGLCKTFEKGGQELKVLRDLDLHLQSGERVAIVGQSGSGKSTFLHVLGTLDRPTSGHRVCSAPGFEHTRSQQPCC